MAELIEGPRLNLTREEFCNAYKQCFGTLSREKDCAIWLEKIGAFLIDFNAVPSQWNTYFETSGLKNAMKKGSTLGDVPYPVGAQDAHRRINLSHNCGWTIIEEGDTAATRKNVSSLAAQNLHVSAEDLEWMNKIADDSAEIWNYVESISGKSVIYPQALAYSLTPTVFEDSCILEDVPNINYCHTAFEAVFSNFMGEGEGLSLPWLLIAPTNSTAAEHVEDELFCSISVNFGPGWKIWIVVPGFQTRNMVLLYAYLDSLNIASKDGSTACGHEYRFKNFSCTRALFAKFKIQPHFFIQHPNTVVYLGPGILHSVYNLGGSASQARNFVDEHWLAVTNASLALRNRCRKMKRDETTAALHQWSQLLRDRLLATTVADIRYINSIRFPPKVGKKCTSWKLPTTKFLKMHPGVFLQETLCRIRDLPSVNFSVELIYDDVFRGFLSHVSVKPENQTRQKKRKTVSIGRPDQTSDLLHLHVCTTHSCNKVFQSRAALLLHQRGIHKMRYVCSDCFEKPVFTTPQSLKYHQNAFHRIGSSNKAAQHKRRGRKTAQNLLIATSANNNG
ncbi:uncharacterized protein LOC129602816 [Paramacrobiotus metropolitanus]|uniref:uncharacterized protein LOC129602816 n=1 Tax=Paramacrobiotus metropolitanus TaxID=2943436 RepID=UPI0024465C36|nr:uncharacterized protein LOC129602816 [Paramacrobiotus metropolitanus]